MNESPSANVACRSCQAGNPAESLFCSQCGAPLSVDRTVDPELLPAMPVRRTGLLVAVGIVAAVGVGLLIRTSNKAGTDEADLAGRTGTSDLSEELALQEVVEHKKELTQTPHAALVWNLAEHLLDRGFRRKGVRDPDSMREIALATIGMYPLRMSGRPAGVTTAWKLNRDETYLSVLSVSQQAEYSSTLREALLQQARKLVQVKGEVFSAGFVDVIKDLGQCAEQIHIADRNARAETEVSCPFVDFPFEVNRVDFKPPRDRADRTRYYGHSCRLTTVIDTYEVAYSLIDRPIVGGASAISELQLSFRKADYGKRKQQGG